jgi:hypothetical protein
MYEYIVCAGVFLDPDYVRPVTNGKLDEYSDELLPSRMIAGGSTGCILIKRRVIAQGIVFFAVKVASEGWLDRVRGSGFHFCFSEG